MRSFFQLSYHDKRSNSENELIFTPEITVNFSLICAVMSKCMTESVSCNRHPDKDLHLLALLSIYSGKWVANE